MPTKGNLGQDPNSQESARDTQSYISNLVVIPVEEGINPAQITLSNNPQFQDYVLITTPEGITYKATVRSLSGDISGALAIFARSTNGTIQQMAPSSYDPITREMYLQIDGIPQVQSNWGELGVNDPSYIRNKPTIPAAQVQSDWTQANSGAVDYIKNKPTLPSEATTTTPGLVTLATQQQVLSADPLANKEAVTPSLMNFQQQGAGAVLYPLVSKMQQTVSVKDFGAVGDGVTDDYLAWSKALDFITLEGGEINGVGGETYFVSQPIIIPVSSTTQQRPIKLIGNGSTFKGTMLTNIIETGKTTYSVNGESNWDATPEKYLHGNLEITGFIFSTFNIALKLYNAVFNSAVQDNYFVVGKTAITAKRSFYLTITHNTIFLGYAGKPDNEASVILSTFVNTVYMNDNHIANQIGGEVPKGIGLSVDDGAYALNIADCTIESCKIGIYITGTNYPLNIQDCYFEGNEKSIYHQTGQFLGLIMGNFFNDPITFESDGSPAVDFYDNNNFRGGAINVPVSTSNISIINRPMATEIANITTKLSRPSTQNINTMSKQFTQGGKRITYNGAIGFNGVGASSLISYEDQLMSFNYFGVPVDTANGAIPFCDITKDQSVGTATITTRIKMVSLTVPTNGGIEIDLTIYHFLGISYISGRTLNDGTVFRFDSVGFTMTVSDNAGYAQIVIGSLPTDSTVSIYGRVRVV